MHHLILLSLVDLAELASERDGTHNRAVGRVIGYEHVDIDLFYHMTRPWTLRVSPL